MQQEHLLLAGDTVVVSDLIKNVPILKEKLCVHVTVS